ncbi:FliA/WhiG family RNA polymerase sigma factor [Algisphaera agarilytica]|uniref:RNA polymerase sigma factor n=1 Tax=Algisphaera agarilytica TaxID=1385975 RepID=A0A7X0H7K6_9BACT|nr:FliA/WhiG family RNA polymerase sigma factor [Algisphaera agarilytica]MBB6430760.1 RNA polymerase sigma factor for flagellar operon FliA [Algisphaera agarilytica]
MGLALAAKRYQRLEPVDRDTASSLWSAYRESPDRTNRNALMELYLPVVRYNAQRIHLKLPESVELGDLISAGTFGLVDAIEGFDPERGIKFETYCAPRIRGAILDELRSLDWVPRLVRSRSTQVEKARRSLTAQTGVAPTDSELRQQLGVDRDEFAKIKRDSTAVGTVSLSRRFTTEESGRELGEIDVLQDTRQINPLSAISRRDLKELVTKGLSRHERMIVVLYYYEAMTMREIGRVLDLSESRVSQMHSSILLRLKAQLQHKANELAELNG